MTTELSQAGASSRTTERRARMPSLQLTCAENGSLTATMEASGPDEFAGLFGGAAREFADQAVHDLLNVALTAAPNPGAVNTSTVNALLQAVGSVEPADELEAMLAVQLATFHHITLCCLRRSQQSTTTLEGRALNLNQANRCARTFTILLDSLNRHRGKGTTQRVIVENVTVEAGGQAVVGAVAGGGGVCKSRGSTPCDGIERSRSQRMRPRAA
jgi:hypothetical protein